MSDKDFILFDEVRKLWETKKVQNFIEKIKMVPGIVWILSAILIVGVIIALNNPDELSSPAPETPETPISTQANIDSTSVTHKTWMDSLASDSVNIKDSLNLIKPVFIGWPDSAQSNNFQGKIVQLTGYFDECWLFRSAQKCATDDNSGEHVVCSPFSSGDTTMFDTSRPVGKMLKVSIKGRLRLFDPINSSFGGYSLEYCSIVDSQYISIEPYLKQPSWESLMRNLYGEDKCIIYAKVLESGPGYIRGSMDGYAGDCIFIPTDGYPKYDNGKNIIENDVIKILGSQNGTRTYTSVLGADITIPEIKPIEIVFVRYGG